MKTPAAVVLVAITLAALVAPPAAAQQIWTEQRITNTSWSEVMPQIYGDEIYYGDRRNGYGEIYVFDQTQGARRLVGGDGISRGVWGVYGDKLVTTRRVNNQYDLYTWDPVNGEVAVSTAPGDQLNGRAFGNLLVWEDYRAGSQNPRVYMWDPINGERRISASETPQKSPKVWGNRVIWQQGHEVWMWTPDGGATRIGYGDYSAIYQDRMVSWYNAWYEPQPGGNPTVYHPGYLYEWTPATGFDMILQHDKSISSLETWGNLVLLGGTSVGAWDPVHGFNIVNQSNRGLVTSFSVYDNKIAWAGNNDIYVSTLVPEPTSLLALLAGLGSLGTMLCRRRREESR